MSNPEQPAVVEPQLIDDEFYREIFRVGHRVAMRVHGDYHLAEEAAADGAVVLWQTTQKKEIEYPRAFALQSVRFAALNQLRKLKKTHVDSETVEATLDGGDHTDPYDTFDTCAAVMEVVKTLNDRRASETRTKIFQLAAAEFKANEIAEILQLKPVNVQRQLDRGRAKLRERREEFGL